MKANELNTHMYSLLNFATQLINASKIEMNIDGEKKHIVQIYEASQ